MTNLYLNQAEYDTLLALGGAPLTKRRYGYLQAGMRYSLDIFEGPLAGLILAEIEAHAAGEITRLPVPVFAVREVTADPAFSGGALAQLSPQAFARWQAEW
jgi:CYTH domain-containing protein